RADLVALAPQLRAAMSGAIGGEAQRRVNRARVNFEATLQALVKRGERRARHVGARARPRDGNTVAARHERHAELALDAAEMLVALAIELRQQGIVVELHLHAAAARAAIGRGHAGTSSPRRI